MSQDNSKHESIPSGIPALDEITGGWQNANLIVIASRPSVGKTAFATSIACNAALDYDIPVAYFSLELSFKQLVERLIIPKTKLGKFLVDNSFNTGQWRNEGPHKISPDVPLLIDDTPGLSVKDFHEKAKKLVDEENVRLIIIDYLQLMTGLEEYRAQREEEEAYVVNNLKSVAEKLKVPIIVLVQLPRFIFSRYARYERPKLETLRKSSPSIEGAADLVVFIHRPDMAGISEDPSDRQKTELIIAKNRNGEIGGISMKFTSENLSFSECDVPSVRQESEIVREQNFKKCKIASRLNTQQTLNNFKITPTNAEAVKVAIDFIGNLENSRLMFLVGPSKSGKTHLVNAIGNAIEPDRIVLYVTGIEFISQYLEASKTNHLKDLRSFYTKVDVLILDDLQDMVNSEVQKTFYDIIFRLWRTGKQLVVTSAYTREGMEDYLDKTPSAFLRQCGRNVKIGGK